MTYQRPRNATVALVDGREFEATRSGDVVTLHAVTDPHDPRFTGTPTGWEAQVALTDCERLDEVTTRADHLGHECLVVGIAADGSTGLYYLGPDKTKAAADGFVQIDPGTWAKNVPVHELTRLREHHADLLFPEWIRSR
ncbi:hypothetical protein [Actinokineospora sp. NBRC 105648]|uniref:hypothetical protein n=1 Tax=Actinokineospora sp. NBRC 105648 TaxID=3032206 RepID=UPI0024A21D51|nr:hypothetical protein [Actinokineospora sp. NBRC 105648]GLZ37491.1 hypothetical protein Acsp05_11160 [Actinokineospora sp. NBRC 105648]